MLSHPTEARLHLLEGRLYVEVIPYQDEQGYLVVSLTVGGRTRHEKLHRLLWEFYNQEEIPEGLMVRHLNDNKLDNREVNLALGSHKDNVEDRRRNGGDLLGEDNPARKLDEEAVRDVRKRYDSGESIASIHKEYSYVSRSTLAVVAKRKAWKHVKE